MNVAKHNPASSAAQTSPSKPTPSSNVPIETSMSIMNFPQQPEPSSEPATVEDIIGWLEEQALHSGEFGFSTTWCPGEILAIASRRNVPKSSAAAPISDEIDMHTALGHAVTDGKRHKYLASMIQKNRGMLGETTKVVHERLLMAGMPEKELQKLDEQKVGLRTKIAMLQGLQNQRWKPGTGERFAVWLMTEEKIAMKKVKVFLPRRGNFAHFLAVLQDIWLATPFPDAELGQGFNFGTGAWIYRLVNKHSQIVAGTPRVKLVDEFDYRDMVKQITKDGTETPTAVFWHESTIENSDKVVGKKAKAEDKDENKETDAEDPDPQSVDWKFLIESGVGWSNHRFSQ